MLTYALTTLKDEESASLHRLLTELDVRARAAAPDGPPTIAPHELDTLFSAFDQAPAQLHPALLSFLDKARGAAALALCLAPRESVRPVVPILLPILLDPSASRAARSVLALLEGPSSAVGSILGAFQQLSLSAHAAVTSELPAAAMALCILASSPRVFPPAGSVGGVGQNGSTAVTSADAPADAVDAAEAATATAAAPTSAPMSLAAAWRTLESLSQCQCPSEEQLVALHAALQLLGRSQSGRLSRCMGEPGALLEAAPHLPCLRWVGLVTSMKAPNGRLAVQHSQVSRALLAAETRSLGRTFVQHPEQRSIIGFVCGWFLLLVAFFGAIDEMLLRQDLLHLMLGKGCRRRQHPSSTRPAPVQHPSSTRPAPVQQRLHLRRPSSFLVPLAHTIPSP